MIFLDCMDNVKFVSIFNKNYNDISYTYIVFNNKLFKKYNKLNKYFKKMYMFFLKRTLNIDKLTKNCYNNNSKFITSKELDKNIELKKFIISNFFDCRNFKEVAMKNTIIKNSIKYLKNFNYNSKVIIITYKKFDIDIINEYINNFKNIDILCVNNNYDIKFLNEINNLNIEYGTSIKFIKSRDLVEYDVCILNERVDFNGYKFKDNVFILDVTNSENDIYSNLYHSYLKYKNYIINEENFSSNKIGNLLTKVFNDV